MARSAPVVPPAGRTLPGEFLLNPVGLHALTKRPSGPDVFPSVILSGAEGMGKGTLAAAWACALNCLTITEGQRACGTCRQCRRLLEGQHPDLVALAMAGESTQIKVEQVRDLQDRLAYRPFEAQWRVVTVERADALSEGAANCLLKTLEEPPPQTVFVLQTQNHAQMLPTIQSRCRVFKFLPIDEAQLSAWMAARGHAEERAVLAARLAGGAPGRAIGLLTDKAWWAARESTLDIYRQLTSGRLNPQTVAELSDQYAKALPSSGARAKLLQHFDIAVSFMRDGLLLQEDASMSKRVYNVDQVDALQAVVKRGGAGRWVRTIQQMLDARLQVEGNVNGKMVVALLFRQVADNFAAPKASR